MRGELAVELAKQRDAIGEPQFGARRCQGGVLRRRGAVDDEARARKRLEYRPENRSVTQSCAQATRARRASTAPG